MPLWLYEIPNSEKKFKTPNVLTMFSGAGVDEGCDDVGPLPDERLRKRPQRRRHLPPQGSIYQPGKFP